MKIEGILKAAGLFFGILLVILSLNSLSLSSNIKAYLDDETAKRLLNLDEIVAKDLGGVVDKAVQDPYTLYSISIQESAEIVLLDKEMRVIASSLPNHKIGSEYRNEPGIDAGQINRAWRGQKIVSPFYKKKGRLVRSVYFTLKASDSSPVLCEVTLDAQHVENLTQQNSTMFLLKAMSGLFILLAIFYIVRSLVQYNRPDKSKEETGGNVSFVVNTFHTVVSELKEKEKELQDLKYRAEVRAKSIETYNESVLKNIQSGVITFDKTGVVVTSNKAADEILNTDAGSLVGRICSDVFAEESWITSLIDRTLSEGKTERRGEGELHSAPGGTKWIGVGTSPLMGPDGLLDGAILVFTDITEVTELREMMELKERIAVLGEMSAGIAHELRNPMGVINGYAGFLARKLGGDAQSKDAVDSIISEIKVMDEIIREFMSFAQPTELNITEVDINGVADEAVRALPAEAGSIRPEFHPAEGLPRIQGDFVLLRQVFVNLVKNAVEATHGGGSVSIST
ncbi:MAG TPA: histidine kinase dimerization/phospho-acceptor domain-containing protein, partial [Nitrospirota bacterium]